MIVTTYNQHVRLLSSEPLVGLRLQSLLGPGSRHCYGIITLKMRAPSPVIATSTWIARPNPTQELRICAPDSRTGRSEIIADGLQRSRQILGGSDWVHRG